MLEEARITNMQSLDSALRAQNPPCPTPKLRSTRLRRCPCALTLPAFPMFLSFLTGLDADLRDALLQKLRVRWTHSSTALEGNTLSEGETLGVLQYGLTISGKPLAHHNEVLGHSRAIDLLYEIGRSGRDLLEADLFALHVAIQTAAEIDIYKPIGAWKVEPNSTVAKIGGKAVINDTYAQPAAVPTLMNQWLTEFNRRRRADTNGLDDYLWAHATLVRIHPFADGNGRMARLLANLPMLEKSHLPLLLPSSERLRYIEALATWQLACGPLRASDDLMAAADSLTGFRLLCEEAVKDSESSLQEVRSLQQARTH